MGERGQMTGPMAGLMFLAAGAIVVSIVAIVYNGIDKTTLIGGSENIGNLIPLVAVSAVVLGGIFSTLFVFFGRRG